MPFPFAALARQDRIASRGEVDLRHPSGCVIISGPIAPSGWPHAPYTLFTPLATFHVEADRVHKVPPTPAYELTEQGTFVLRENPAA